MSWDLVVGVVAAVVTVLWLFRGKRRGDVAAPETPAVAVQSVHATLSPRVVRPNNRPSSLAAIGRRLELLGAVEGTELSVAVVDASGARVFVTAPHVGAVTVSELKLEAWSAELLVLVADAIALELGPLVLNFSGLELDLDGTTPRGVLLKKLESLQSARQPQLLH